LAIREQHKVSATARVFLQTDTDVWQVRFTDPRSGKWLSRTSKQKNLVQALAVANDIAKGAVPTLREQFRKWYQLQPKTLDSGLECCVSH